MSSAASAALDAANLAFWSTHNESEQEKTKSAKEKRIEKELARYRVKEEKKRAREEAVSGTSAGAAAGAGGWVLIDIFFGGVTVFYIGGSEVRLNFIHSIYWFTREN